MMTRVRAALMFALAIWMIIGSMVEAAVQPAIDKQGIVRAATDLLNAAGTGDADHLYDRLAPEERDLIPRQAFVIWLGEASPLPAGTPEIGEISEGTWISPLTGDRYDAVFVAYTVEAAPGQETGARSGDLALWHDGQEWRWLFDGEPQDIAMVTDDAAWSLAYESPYRDGAYGDIDRFWAQVFAQRGIEYRPPVDAVAVVVQPIETGCGTDWDISRRMVYYCLLDETIYYDPEFRDSLTEQIGEFAWVHVIAHEWGHHVQQLLGITTSRDPETQGGQPRMDHELQADCLAAIFEQDAYARGLIDAGDLAMVRTVTILAGDVDDASPQARSSHGTGSQRQQSYDLGFDDGFIGCNVSLEAAG